MILQNAGSTHPRNLGALQRSPVQFSSKYHYAPLAIDMNDLGVAIEFLQEKIKSIPNSKVGENNIWLLPKEAVKSYYNDLQQKVAEISPHFKLQGFYFGTAEGANTHTVQGDSIITPANEAAPRALISLKEGDDVKIVSIALADLLFNDPQPVTLEALESSAESIQPIDLFKISAAQRMEAMRRRMPSSHISGANAERITHEDLMREL